MHIVILHIVENSEVIVDIAAPVEVLRQKVEPDIVPVRWLDLVSGSAHMSEVFAERQLRDLRVKHRHLTLEELIFTSIVVCVLISHAQS